MNELRETVSKAIADEWMRYTDDHQMMPGSDQLADAAIAAFAEAMRQPEVVARVARSIHIEGLSGVALNRAMTRPLKVTEENHRQAHAAIDAMLAAIGAVEGERT